MSMSSLSRTHDPHEDFDFFQNPRQAPVELMILTKIFIFSKIHVKPQ